MGKFVKINEVMVDITKVLGVKIISVLDWRDTINARIVLENTSFEACFTASGYKKFLKLFEYSEEFINKEFLNIK